MVYHIGDEVKFKRYAQLVAENGHYPPTPSMRHLFKGWHEIVDVQAYDGSLRYVIHDQAADVNFWFPESWVLKHREKVEEGSGNIFHDLGQANAEELLFKSRILLKERTRLDAGKTTRQKIMDKYNMDAYELDLFLSGKPSALPTESVFAILNK